MANELNQIPEDSYCSNIKLIAMQTARMVQAVVLMMIVALAASCAVSKEYSSKIFKPRNPVKPDSQSTKAIRFLTTDSIDKNSDEWVTTDIINGRDSLNQTTALDNLSKTFPSSEPPKDSVFLSKSYKNDSPAVIEEGNAPKTEEPVAKTNKQNGVRSKRMRNQ
jgi:hypothetical protein